VILRGQLDEFLSFLKMGQFVHVGGKTTFGCGKYVLN
ncbi:TPA: CRISPR system precrRNA processing endoribonuclease RAMP protein Cas6, partial [Candidatus Poribacteria bacterium]|nr:CRISPR system precrRNA processing endoribonuclease RAMP protein Cas6 [Candidatus Poribacteria bacterium]